MKRTIRMLLRRTSQGALLFLLLAVGLATAATAQREPLATAEPLGDAFGLESLPHPSAVTLNSGSARAEWIALIDAQFAEALHSSIEDVRAKTLQNIIYVATFHGDLVTLKATVPSLVEVYRLDAVGTHRLMAVQALQAIGDAYGMQRLREEVADQLSPRVRAVTEAALAAYYQGL